MIGPLVKWHLSIGEVYKDNAMKTVSDEFGKVHGFHPCCGKPDIVEQDTSKEPIWCCAECGTFHNTPETEEE